MKHFDQVFVLSCLFLHHQCPSEALKLYKHFQIRCVDDNVFVGNDCKYHDIVNINYSTYDLEIFKISMCYMHL